MLPPCREWSVYHPGLAPARCPRSDRGPPTPASDHLPGQYPHHDPAAPGPATGKSPLPPFPSFLGCYCFSSCLYNQFRISKKFFFGFFYTLITFLIVLFLFCSAKTLNIVCETVIHVYQLNISIHVCCNYIYI